MEERSDVFVQAGTGNIRILQRDPSRRYIMLDKSGRKLEPPRWTAWDESGDLDPELKSSLPKDYPPKPPVFSVPHHVWTLCYALTSRRHGVTTLFKSDIPDSRLLEFEGDRILSVWLQARVLEKFPEADGAELWTTAVGCMAGQQLSIIGKMLGLDRNAQYWRELRPFERHREILRDAEWVPAEQIEDVLEAFIAAVYRCFGWQVLSRWLTKLFDPWIDLSNTYINDRRTMKSQRQENSRLIKPPYIDFVNEFLVSDRTKAPKWAVGVAKRIEGMNVSHRPTLPPCYPPLLPSFESIEDPRLQEILSKGLDRRYATIGHVIQQAVAVDQVYTDTRVGDRDLEGLYKKLNLVYYMSSLRMTRWLGASLGLEAFMDPKSLDGVEECFRSLLGFLHASFGFERTRDWLKAFCEPWIDTAYAEIDVFYPPVKSGPNSDPKLESETFTSFQGERTFPYVHKLTMREILQYSDALRAYTSWNPEKLIKEKKKVQPTTWLYEKPPKIRYLHEKHREDTMLPEGLELGKEATVMVVTPRLEILRKQSKEFGLKPMPRRNWDPIPPVHASAEPNPTSISPSQSRFRNQVKAPPPPQGLPSRVKVLKTPARTGEEAGARYATVLQEVVRKSKRLKRR